VYKAYLTKHQVRNLKSVENPSTSHRTVTYAMIRENLFRGRHRRGWEVDFVASGKSAARQKRKRIHEGGQLDDAQRGKPERRASSMVKKR